MPKDHPPTDFLDVSCSLSGRRWVGPSIEDDRLSQALRQATGLPGPVCRILARAGVSAGESEAFLEPKLRDLMPDPRRLKDMETAAARICDAVERAERIAVFADYDVDGGASAAVLIGWLRELGRPATLYVPDRIDEGYGPNSGAMSRLAADHDLIVCVDGGAASPDAIAAAEGADVIVFDHHLGSDTPLPAIAHVNPNRADEDGELGHLCSAAVVFLALVEANRRRREAGRSAPNMMEALDLVALATVADVSPLRGVNRAFVRQGLRVLSRRRRPGLRALADIVGINSAPTTRHLCYILAPRINAGGRVGRSDLGARLLSTDDYSEAEKLAVELDKLNIERREIEGLVMDEATAQVEARALADAPLVWAAGDDWHPGVVGIVASRLKELYGRPAVVIGINNGVGKGSGRSVPGVDLGTTIQRLAGEGLLVRGGGHPMAAGLTVESGRLREAMERLSMLVERQGADIAGSRDLRVDAILMPGGATLDLMEQIESAGPFGSAAPAPRFALPSQPIRSARLLENGHLKLSIGGVDGSLAAFVFGAMHSPLRALSDGTAGRWHFAGLLETSEFRGRRSTQLKLEDAAPAE